MTLKTSRWGDSPGLPDRHNEISRALIRGRQESQNHRGDVVTEAEARQKERKTFRGRKGPWAKEHRQLPEGMQPTNTSILAQ